jgi:hypothetical protein
VRLWDIDGSACLFVYSVGSAILRMVAAPPSHGAGVVYIAMPRYTPAGAAADGEGGGDEGKERERDAEGLKGKADKSSRLGFKVSAYTLRLPAPAVSSRRDRSGSVADGDDDDSGGGGGGGGHGDGNGSAGGKHGSNSKKRGRAGSLSGDVLSRRQVSQQQQQQQPGKLAVFASRRIVKGRGTLHGLAVGDKWLVAVGGKSLYLWQRATLDLRCLTHTRALTSVALHPREECVAVGDDEGHMGMWYCFGTDVTDTSTSLPCVPVSLCLLSSMS